MFKTAKRSFYGKITDVVHKNNADFIGDEITLDGKRTFWFPSIFENEFKEGRRIFMDFEAWPRDSCVYIHIFKSDAELEKECNFTASSDDICYVKTYSLLREFVPWAPRKRNADLHVSAHGYYLIKKLNR